MALIFRTWLCQLVWGQLFALELSKELKINPDSIGGDEFPHDKARENHTVIRGNLFARKIQSSIVANLNGFVFYVEKEKVCAQWFVYCLL